MKRLLSLFFIGFASAGCAASEAADSSYIAGGGSSSNSGQTSIFENAYADVLAVTYNSTAAGGGNIEVFKSTDGKMRSAPSVGIEGAYSKGFAVVDNNAMLVLTDKGLYHSKDGWKTFRLSMGIAPTVDPYRPTYVSYIGNNTVLFYNGDTLLINFKGGEGSSPECPVEAGCAWADVRAYDARFASNISGKSVSIYRLPLVK